MNEGTKERKYSEWDMQDNRRFRIGDDCYRAYQSGGQEQYLKGACRIDELEGIAQRALEQNQRLLNQIDRLLIMAEKGEKRLER